MTVAVPVGLAQLLTELAVDPDRAVLTRRPGRAAESYLCLPSPERPQVLVPMTRWAGGMVTDRRARGARAAMSKRAVAFGLSSGTLGLLPVRRLSVSDPVLAELTTWLTGSPGTRLGVLSGPPRANRKPVLRLFTAAGETLGYAKLGHTPLAAELVRRETEALAVLSRADLTGLRAPDILKSGDWRGRSVLVTSPLAGNADVRQPTGLPVAATRSLFELGARHDLPLQASSIFTAAPPTDELGAGGPELAALADRLRAALGERRFPLGAAHGDWTPWNMAWSADVLEAWDWERFATDLPAGHDVVHFEASRVQATSPGAGEERLLRELPRQLERCGLDPGLADAQLALYLLVIARRYAADLARERVSSGTARLDWVVRLLRVETDRVERGATG